VGDFGDCISRVRRLNDGRLLATGVIRTNVKERRAGEPLLMLSADDGKTWQPQIIELPPAAKEVGAWNEWDWAELSAGDLLCVFRRTAPEDRRKQVRWQGILARRGNGWSLDAYGPAPLEHSGHPELLATSAGPILHIATTGAHYTADAGKTWQPLEMANAQAYRSRYYPRSLQAEDGRVFVFSHIGSDNAYGQVDQAIVMDTFRLTSE
jgi:hypothetical protein